MDFKKIIIIECFLFKNMKYFDKLFLICRFLDDGVKKNCCGFKIRRCYWILLMVFLILVYICIMLIVEC